MKLMNCFFQTSAFLTGLFFWLKSKGTKYATQNRF